MQLAARQRYFARIMVWALPVSAALGAVFGGFNLPNEFIRGYICGAVAGTLISATALLLEFVVFSGTLSALVRRVPFLLYLALRSLVEPLVNKIIGSFADKPTESGDSTIVWGRSPASPKRPPCKRRGHYG